MPHSPAAAAAQSAHRPATLPAPASSLGLAFLGRLVFEGDQLAGVWNELIAKLTTDARDAGAMLDLSTLLQMRGDREGGLKLQASALAISRCYRTSHGAGGALRILAFMTPGDLMANTPLDFLLEGSDVELTTVYLEGAVPAPEDLPDHDIAFLAISQADDGSQALSGLIGAFDAWPRPVVNGRAELIAALTRNGVADRFAGHPRIVCPATRQVERAALTDVAAGDRPLAALHADLAWPVIVRPIGSHAGKGLEKLDGPAELAAYLAGHPAQAFFVAAFYDYAGADGLYRKLRVVFVNGQPYVAHMAVSERWMVHYLNADMGKPANRREEARMMETFDQGFAARHAEAFAALTEAFGLDYYGVDCAETRDGRLVVFEADVAMIVHAMDSAELYPYKKPAMARLFTGFIAGMSALVEQRRRLAA